MPLKLNSSGGGSVTLDVPSTASNYTVTIPAATGTMVTTGAGQTVEFAAGTASAPSITATGDTNNGIFFPATDATAITTAGSERMRVDSSGNMLVGSTATPTSMTNAVVNKSTAKAWIKLTDNGTTVTTNASFNISSVTRNTTGSYTLNFTAALSTSEYCVVGGGGCNTTSLRVISLPYNTSGPATTYTPIQLVSSDGALGAATQYLFAAVFGASY